MKNQKNENISSSDLHLINDLNAALQTEKHRGMFAVIILFFILIIVFLIWAYNSTVEEVTRGQGSVIPSSREQIVQSGENAKSLSKTIVLVRYIQANQNVHQMMFSA